MAKSRIQQGMNIIERFLSWKGQLFINKLKAEGAEFNDEEIDKCKISYTAGFLESANMFFDLQPKLRDFLESMEKDLFDEYMK